MISFHDKEFTEKNLKNGVVFEMNNQSYIDSIGDDDLRGARIQYFDDSLGHWRTGFQLWFNGGLIHHCKTFKSLENRLTKLIDKWHLLPCDEDESGM
jgi:hypothetical protein